MNDFHSQGFEIVREVFTKDEVEAMREEADRLSKNEGSACVRHIRSKSKEFNQLAKSVRLQNLLSKGLSPVRSILFDKTPQENWPVTWHQDLTITVEEKCEIKGYGPWSTKDGSVHVQPPVEVLERMMTIRIHLDDTPQKNGALRVIPESHKRGKIESREVLSHVNASEAICACGAGDVLLMSPLILHSSKRSESPKRRRILHFEYARLNSLDDRLSWHEPSQSEPVASGQHR
ncbi:MAG: phytanoyl-CoA dioxygenase family protein [Verrucomicrobiota bacterium]